MYVGTYVRAYVGVYACMCVCVCMYVCVIIYNLMIDSSDICCKAEVYIVTEAS